MSQVTIMRVSAPLEAARCAPQCIEEREVEFKVGADGDPRRVTTHLSKTSYEVRYGDATGEVASARAAERQLSDNLAIDYVIVGPNDFLDYTAFVPTVRHSKITVIENQLLSLWFYPETRILHHQLHTFVPVEPFEELLVAGLRYIERQEATKWLSDNSGNPIVPQQTAQWARTFWAPRAIGAGFRYWAAVMPVEMVGRMQMRKFIDEYADLGVTVQPFEEVGKALHWLERIGTAAAAT